MWCVVLVGELGRLRSSSATVRAVPTWPVWLWARNQTENSGPGRKRAECHGRLPRKEGAGRVRVTSHDACDRSRPN